ncbi:MAG: hypothetical protein ABF649_15345 [Bacillus sp. (in: firmicutes)]
MKTDVNRSIVSVLFMFLFLASLLFYLNLFLVQEIATIKENASLYQIHTIKSEMASNNMDMHTN